MGLILVITTVPDENFAVKLSESLLQQRLAACVHQLPAGKSTYRWNGAIETASEVTLFIKTRQSQYAALEAAIAQMHPYDTPEIIAFAASAGLPAYLQWVDHETD